MKRFITSKYFFYDEKEKYLMDYKKNKVLIGSLSESNSKKILKLDSDIPFEVLLNLDIVKFDEYTNVVNENDNGYRIEIDDILELCRKLENIAMLCLAKKLKVELKSDYDNYYEEYLYLEDLTNNANINKEIFLKKVNELKSKNEKFFKIVTLKQNILSLNEFIRDELKNIEYQFKHIIYYGYKFMEANYNCITISFLEEYRSMGRKIDIIYFSIKTIIKSIVSILDGISKLLHLIQRLLNNGDYNIPNVMNEKILSYKSNNKEKFNGFKQIFKNIKFIVNIRNKITHNGNLNNVRHFIFCGYKTPNINNLELIYLDIPFLDYKTNQDMKDKYDFYYEQNNALDILKFIYDNIFKLYKESLELMINDIEEGNKC